MNSKYLFTILAVVVLIIIALFVFNSNKDTDQLAGNTNATANTNTAPSNNNTNTPPANIDQAQPDGNDVAVFEINFDGKAFTPSQLTIKQGDVVVFKNNSTGSFWPASGPHPQHTNYPEFDPKKSIGPGQSWEFKFTKVGTWPFHDHLTPTAFGKIIVE